MRQYINYHFLRSWIKSKKSINPFTKRPIKKNSATYKKLEKIFQQEMKKLPENYNLLPCPYCKSYFKTPDGWCHNCINNTYISKNVIINMNISKPPYLCEKTDEIDYDFIKVWQESTKMINPFTGNPIRYNGPTFRHLQEKYNEEYDKLPENFHKVPCLNCKSMRKTITGLCIDCLGNKEYYK